MSKWRQLTQFLNRSSLFQNRLMSFEHRTWPLEWKWLKEFWKFWGRLEEFGGVWRRLEEFGEVWKSLEKFGGVWKRLEEFEWGWRRLEEFGEVWRSLEEFGGVWRSLEEVGGVWRSLEEFGGVWRSLEEFLIMYVSFRNKKNATKVNRLKLMKQHSHSTNFWNFFFTYPTLDARLFIIWKLKQNHLFHSFFFYILSIFHLKINLY